MPHLENWGVVFEDDFYLAPELRIPRLQGIVTGHPFKKDGQLVTTSRLTYLKVIGKVAQTASGHEYSLGAPDPKFIEFIKKNGYDIEKYTFGTYK